jgi:hypothetical protein
VVMVSTAVAWVRQWWRRASRRHCAKPGSVGVSVGRVAAPVNLVMRATAPTPLYVAHATGTHQPVNG